MSVHNTSTKWTDEMTEKFILLYQDYPALWDSRHVEYKSKTTRIHYLQKIVDAMDIDSFTVQLAKVKIKNIRSHYCQELRKIHYSECLGNERQRYKPSLSWFPIIDGFLRNHVQQSYKEGGDAKSGYDLMNDSDIKLPADLKQDVQQLPIEFESNDTRSENHNNLFYERPSPRTRARRRFRRIRWCRESSVPESEFDVFCRSVAMQMNQMPLPNALNLQKEILNVVAHMRLNGENKK